MICALKLFPQLSIPFTDKGSYSITFDPTKSTGPQLGEYLCVEKQVELGITTQEQLDSCIAGVARYIEANYQAQTSTLKPAPVSTSDRKQDIRVSFYRLSSMVSYLVCCRVSLFPLMWEIFL